MKQEVHDPNFFTVTDRGEQDDDDNGDSDDNDDDNDDGGNDADNEEDQLHAREDIYEGQENDAPIILVLLNNTLRNNEGELSTPPDDLNIINMISAMQNNVSDAEPAKDKNAVMVNLLENRVNSIHRSISRVCTMFML